MLTCMGAFAQENVPGMMEVVKGRLCFDGTALSSSQVLNLIGENVYDETYAGAVRQFKSGKGLMIAGCTVAGVGLIGVVIGCATLYQDDSYVMEDMLNLSIGVCAIGDLLLSAGVPLYCIGKSRLSWVADNYNRKYASRTPVTLAPASHGLGLAVRF